MTIADEIREVNAVLAEDAENIGALLRRGALFYRNGSFGAAANDFRKVLLLDAGNIEAEGYLYMIDEIQNFRNTDLMNP